MWNSFFQRQRDVWNGSPGSMVGSRARRRQRRAFAGAEPLETRTLLSATGADSLSEALSTSDLADSLPSVPADIALIEDANSKLATGLDGLVQGQDFGSGLLDQLSGSDSALGIADEMLAALAQNSPLQRASVVNFKDFSNNFTGVLSDDAESTVELRFAETGQVVTVGSTASAKDGDGLTIKDDSSPTTYVRTTDADGQVHSRLVFVTRTSRSAPRSEPNSPTDASGVIVADVEFSAETISEELAARPDLHDLATALDTVNEEDPTPSPTSRRENSPQNLASATRTRWVTSTRVSAATERVVRTANDTHDDAASAQSTSLAIRNTEPGTESNESPAVPIFDPTTRNVVLSVCLLGSLARATALRRRRQKAAFAQ